MRVALTRRSGKDPEGNKEYLYDRDITTRGEAVVVEGADRTTLSIAPCPHSFPPTTSGGPDRKESRPSENVSLLRQVISRR